MEGSENECTANASKFHTALWLSGRARDLSLCCSPTVNKGMGHPQESTAEQELNQKTVAEMTLILGSSGISYAT